MPFTLSHPAAALPFVRTPLPTTAVVAGTMAPDLPMFVPGHRGYPLTHSGVGIVSTDLLIGLLGVVVWVLFLRDALVDAAPDVVRARLAPSARYSSRQWLLAAPAVLVGAATHVGWDEFTHEGRWGARHIAWLREPHVGVAGYHWAQAISTVIGGLVVLAWAAHTLRRSDPVPRAARVPVLTLRGPAVAVAAAVLAAGAVAVTELPEGLHSAAILAAETGVASLACALVAMAGTWHALAARTS